MKLLGHCLAPSKQHRAIIVIPCARRRNTLLSCACLRGHRGDCPQRPRWSQGRGGGVWWGIGALTRASKRAQPGGQGLEGRQGQQHHAHVLHGRQAMALLIVEVGIEQAAVLGVPSPVWAQSDHADVLQVQEGGWLLEQPSFPPGNTPALS